MKPKKLGLAAASLLGAATMLGAATPAHADDVIVCTPGVCDGHGADPLFKIETALNKVLGKWTPDQPAFHKIEGVLDKVNDKW